MSNPIQLKSITNLYCLVEVSESETEDGPSVFKFTSFSYIDADYVAYYGEAPTRKKTISLQLFQDSLRPVPDEDIYLKAPSNITTAPISAPAPVYIKRPKLTNYDAMKGKDLLAKLVLQETETMELLKDHPHPNIVRYHGSIAKRGRIVGLVLDRYGQTLERRVEESEREFDADLCFKSIMSAVEHLHVLGLAHNDLCPMNIMIDENDKPFLIDFGSCQPFGGKLITAGTPGWMEDYFTTSEKSHDQFSLAKIQSWLAKMTTQQTE